MEFRNVFREIYDLLERCVFTACMVALFMSIAVYFG